MKISSKLEIIQLYLVDKLTQRQVASRVGCGRMVIRNVLKWANISSGKEFHGHSGIIRTPTYMSWYAMRQRCNKKKYRFYSRYGGRGIRVCQRWDSFVNFLKDMGERPNGKTLDRLDNNGNYQPDNCKWSIPYEQVHNRRP